MLNESWFKCWVQSTEDLLLKPEMYSFSLAFLCYKSSGTLICGNFSMSYDCFLLLDRWETLQQKKNGKRRISMKYLSWPAWKAMAQRWAFFFSFNLIFFIGYNFYGRSTCNEFVLEHKMKNSLDNLWWSPQTRTLAIEEVAISAYNPQ